jgi:ribosome maturation factor RimP
MPWPLNRIRELLEPSLRHLGYELYGLDQAGPAGRTLRITIDKASGAVSLDDCERVSQVAGPILDQSQLLDDGSYTLEVSSPGAERPLRERAEYERFIGSRVNLRYRLGEASEGIVEGTLLTVDDGGVEVEAREGRRAAPRRERVRWDEILAGRLAVSL